MGEHQIQSATPVFICGHYRSGTSLINHLLDGHPNIVACPIETKFLSTFLPATSQGMSNEDALSKTLLRHFTIQPQYYDKSYGDLDKETFLASFYAHFDQLGNKPQKALDAYVRACGETMHPTSQPKIWIEKTPMNEIFMDEILDIWPNAKFVHIIRDPRDLHNTIRARSSFALHPRTSAHNWLRSLKALSGNKDRLGDDRYFWLTYEQLTSQPEACMRAMLKFLELDFTDSVLVPSSASGTKSWEGNAQQDTHQGVTTKSVGKWRDSKFPMDMRMIEAILASEMSVMGYKPELNLALKDRFSGWTQKTIIGLKEIRYRLKGEKKATY